MGNVQTKPKSSRWEAIIKIRAGICGLEAKNTIKSSTYLRAVSLKGKKDWPSCQLTKERGEPNQENQKWVGEHWSYT